MKKIILINLLLMSIMPFITAQITITNAVFPEAGDVYYTSRDTATPGVVITPAGPNQTWVFDNFIPRFADTANIIPASQGTVAADYPSADVIVPYLGGEGYAETSGDSVVVLGFYGDGGFGFGSGFNVDLNPDLVALATPLDYGDSNTDDFGFFVPFNPDDFPQLQGVLDSILPAGVTIDSIRITYTSTRSNEVDAWGTLTTGHGTFDVLRIKSTEYTNTNFEVKPTFPPIWVDPATFGVNIPFAGMDTTLTYDFVNDVEKTQIMSVNVDDITGEITSIVYKIDPSEVVPIINSGVLNLWNENAINAFPNPAIDRVSFEIKNVPTGKYSFNIYNILGRKLVVKEMQITNNHNIETLDIQHLPRGSYLYNLIDNFGKIVVTKRLVIIKP